RGLGSSGRASALVYGSGGGYRRDQVMSSETRPANGASPSVAIIMGVSGCGKSTIGALLASRLRWEFEDADWFHPASNVDKMHRGIPLTDESGLGWRRSLAGSTTRALRVDTPSSPAPR